MDYEFERDIAGQCAARFSMEQEAFGAWLSEDLRSNQQNIHHILMAIQQLRQQQRFDYEFQGREFLLEANREHVSICANGLFASEDYEHDDFDQGYQNDSSALQAQCGLEDFETMLMAWHNFILQG